MSETSTRARTSSVPALRSRVRSHGVILAGIVIVGAVARMTLAWGRDYPRYLPDEYLYPELARSLAAGDGPAVLGQHASFPALLEPLLIAPLWGTLAPASAIQATQALHAVLLAVAALPVYWIARQLALTTRTALALRGGDDRRPGRVLRGPADGGRARDAARADGDRGRDACPDGAEPACADRIPRDRRARRDRALAVRHPAPRLRRGRARGRAEPPARRPFAADRARTRRARAARRAARASPCRRPLRGGDDLRPLRRGALVGRSGRLPAGAGDRSRDRPRCAGLARRIARAPARAPAGRSRGADRRDGVAPAPSRLGDDRRDRLRPVHGALPRRRRTARRGGVRGVDLRGPPGAPTGAGGRPRSGARGSPAAALAVDRRSGRGRLAHAARAELARAVARASPTRASSPPPSSRSGA